MEGRQEDEVCLLPLGEATNGRENRLAKGFGKGLRKGLQSFMVNGNLSKKQSAGGVGTRFGRRVNKVRPDVDSSAGSTVKNNNHNNNNKNKAKKKNRNGFNPGRMPEGLQLVESGQKVPFIQFQKVTDLDEPSVLQTTVEERVGRPNHVKHCTCTECRRAKRRAKSEPINLKFKAQIKLLERTFQKNNFIKTTKEDWNVIWVSGSLKAHTYSNLTRFQKVNQFPRTFEITRKDQLCRNITRMQQLKGYKNFDFLPMSFVLPGDREDFEKEVHRTMSETTTIDQDGANATGNGVAPSFWIVKPAASACGRGIYLTDNIGEIPVGGEDGNVLVSRYIANPLLLDERKFDLRIYIGVTSFCPLRVYIYEEGLVRLTTEKYDMSNIHDRFVHLTNYSVQKHSDKFVQNDGESDEQAASKWSLSTFRARLVQMGHDPELLFQQIEALCVKTLISIEPQVIAAMEMHVRNPENCFQLFGFDVLVDSDLKPWLLEVNLGPSMTCDSSLDLSIKSAMIADLLTLAGVHPCDVVEQKPKEAAVPKKVNVSNNGAQPEGVLPDGSVTENQLRKLLRQLSFEKKRCGAWKCVYPTETSFVYDGFFLERRPYNDAVVAKLCANTNQSTKRRIEKQLK